MRKTTGAYCPTCEKQTLHAKEGISNLLHLFLSLITVGLWITGLALSRDEVSGHPDALPDLRHEAHWARARAAAKRSLSPDSPRYARS